MEIGRKCTQSYRMRLINIHTHQTVESNKTIKIDSQYSHQIGLQPIVTIVNHHHLTRLTVLRFYHLKEQHTSQSTTTTSIVAKTAHCIDTTYLHTKPVAFTATMEEVSAVIPGSQQWGLGVVELTPSKADMLSAHYAGQKDFQPTESAPI